MQEISTASIIYTFLGMTSIIMCGIVCIFGALITETRKDAAKSVGKAFDISLKVFGVLEAINLFCLLAVYFLNKASFS